MTTATNVLVIDPIQNECSVDDIACLVSSSENPLEPLHKSEDEDDEEDVLPMATEIPGSPRQIPVSKAWCNIKSLSSEISMFVCFSSFLTLSSFSSLDPFLPFFAMRFDCSKNAWVCSSCVGGVYLLF